MVSKQIYQPQQDLRGETRIEVRQAGVVGAGGEAAVLVLHHRHRVHIAAGGHHCLRVGLGDTWHKVFFPIPPCPAAVLSFSPISS